MSERPIAREHYPHFLSIPTRWMDNDCYGHVNNVVYYAFFDTVINEYLIHAGGLDIAADPVVGFAVETGCRFHAPLTFPQTVEAGLRVGHIGTSSVRYEVALFPAGTQTAAADGHFVHVFVDRATGRPCPIPERIGSALTALLPTD